MLDRWVSLLLTHRDNAMSFSLSQEREKYMSCCLDYQTLDEYYKTLEKMNKEELETEFRKHFHLEDKIRRTYNIARSRVFIELIETLDEFSLRRNRNNDKYLDRLRESIFYCIQWCDTYSTIYSFFENYEKEADVCSREEDLLDNIKVSSRRCFKYANAFLEFLVLSRNSAAYLYKKLFNESSPAFSKIINIDGELIFDKEEDVKKFEKNMLIEKADTLESVINQLQDAFYLELDSIDESFSYYAEHCTFNK